MNNKLVISLYLDTRFKKKSGKFPLKLRVYSHTLKKRKLYPTVFEFTETEFNSIWKTEKPRKIYKDTRDELDTLELKAKETVKGLNVNTFEAFEKAFFDTTETAEKDVFFYYNQRIDEFTRQGKISTAESYRSSLRMIKEFYTRKTLPFEVITPEWLKNYQSHMETEIFNGNGQLLHAKKSPTTISIYMRTLRAIFNLAIDEGVLHKEQYPFKSKAKGLKNGFEIKAPKGVKKALDKSDLKLLFETAPQTADQQKAKDYWFFSYVCYGINFKDIAYLQYKDVTSKSITFTRAKTADAGDVEPITVMLNDWAKDFILRYGNQMQSKHTFVFPIITPTETPENKHRQIKNFVRYVNQHMKKFAQTIGIEENVSTYTARHTFATIAVKKSSMEFVSKALGHTSMNTTQLYFKGFGSDEKQQVSNSLLEF